MMNVPLGMETKRRVPPFTTSGEVSRAPVVDAPRADPVDEEAGGAGAFRDSGGGEGPTAPRGW